MNEELFLHLAEIAGVFVGFGALIAMRNGGTDDLFARYLLKAITTGGGVVILIALLPLVIAEYGIEGHSLWMICALAFVPLYVLTIIVVNRTPELGKDWNRRHRTFGRVFVSVGLPLHATMVGAITLILLGVLPGLEAALYATVVTTLLVFDVWTLLMLLYSPGMKPDDRRSEEQADVAETDQPVRP